MGLLDGDRRHGRVFTGEWTTTGRTMPATEPATGDVLGEVGTADADMPGRCAERGAEAAAVDVDLALAELQAATALPGQPWGTLLPTAERRDRWTSRRSH
jgi:hypothetical protein